MSIDQTNPSTPRKPIRLWPGVVAVVLQWLAWAVVPVIAPDVAMLATLVGVACGLVVVVWWLFFSRAPWVERAGALVVMVLAVIATGRVVHASIANGMMGMMLPFYSIPALSLALVVALLASRRWPSGPRRASMVGAILLACGVFALIRTGGITGEGDSDLHWRWTATAEQRLLAQAGNEKDVAPIAAPSPSPVPAVEPTVKKPEAAAATGAPTVPAAPAPVETIAEWPGFRGPARDGIVRGVKIETDWSSSPPVQLWRRPIGPGWSSFAVLGNLICTQEQRGEDEIVAAYNLRTGAPAWRHRDPVRFYESNGGAGPRGTPTVSRGRVYAFGATGLLNALDARSGSVVWSRNAATDTKKNIPGWGFSSSPLVIDDLVIVAVSGQLAGYDAATGQPRWTGPIRGGGYSSPHLVTIDGVAQVVLLSGGGAMSVAPADGTLLWEHSWAPGGVAIVQPAFTAEGDVVITAGDAMGGTGMRRLAARRGPAGWTVEERWTSRALKPYFNDFVVHKGYAYGFDGSILAAIDLNDGARKWKGGRFGSGQLVLLPDQDLLLVVSEEGELALVKAMPDQFTELARFPGIEGKTWNHPVLVGDVLLVRNGEEMAAFRLKLAGR